MKICDVCKQSGKISAIDGLTFSHDGNDLDLCSIHSKQYVDAIELAHFLFFRSRFPSETKWDGYKTRLCPQPTSEVSDGTQDT